MAVPFSSVCNEMVLGNALILREMAQKIADPGKTGNNFILRLQEHPICRKINVFLLSPYYFLLLGALTVTASVFSAELAVYTCFILIALYLSFCGKDYLPLVPIVVCCYIAPSMGNNPGKSEHSIFYGGSGVFLLCLAGIFAVSLILRLCLDPVIGRKAFFACKRKLMSGMLILGGGYLLGGAFSGHYFDHGMSNVVFALLQFVAVFGMYFLFTGTVRWKEVPKGYLAWTGLCVGFVLLFQLLHIYIANHVIVDGVIQRERIYSGWGTYNNIGALLAMMIPFAFHLACLRKQSWIYHLCAMAFLFGVIMTCSRSAILTALVVYVLAFSLVVYKDMHTKSSVLVHIITLAIAGMLLVQFYDELHILFRELLDQGLAPSNRLEIYKEGLKQFAKYPIFGGTFYATDYMPFDFSDIAAFSSFFPPRWHNTVIQLLASCGVVGVAAYVYHRVQTMILFVKKPTVGKGMIVISVLALLGTSLLDCHFFNIGPTLLYSIMLAFAEKANVRLDDWK